METEIRSLLTIALISRGTLLLILLVPLAAAVGFAVGMLFERWYHFSAVKKMSKRFDKLFRTVTKTLEKTEQCCHVFNKHPGSKKLSSSQKKQMQSLCEQLTGELKSISDLNRPESEADSTRSVNNSKKQKLLKPFCCPTWNRNSVDERTGYPDASVYQSSLQELLLAMQKTDCFSAVLFIKLDYYSRHAERYSESVANAFVKKTGQAVLRNLRDQDLLSQITEDLLIVVLPEIKQDQMEKMAHQARQSVRGCRYVHPENETEIFVTASFGYTIFDESLAGENTPDQELWDRCQSALSASQRQGRCQLHEMTDKGTSRMIAG